MIAVDLETVLVVDVMKDGISGWQGQSNLVNNESSCLDRPPRVEHPILSRQRTLCRLGASLLALHHYITLVLPS